jgi:drug/metabolite transporter (DMT)-like permease
MKKISSAGIGSLAIILSGLGYASYGVWSKLMAGFFGDFNQAWIRGILTLAVLLPFGMLSRSFSRIKKQDWKWFVVIALAGGLNQAPYFYGFKYVDVGTGTLLFYLMLLLGTFICGKLFFDEKLTAVKYASLALGVIGLSIIYKFVLTPSQIVPALSLMAAGLIGSAGITFTKKLSSKYSETQILTSFCLVMVPANLLLGSLVSESLPSFVVNVAWLSLLGYTATWLLSNATAIVGFKYLEPSIAGLLGLLEVVFGALLGLWLLGEVITTNMIVGGGIIIAAAALPDVAKLIQRK